MIYFREVREPHLQASDSAIGRYWHVECYEENVPGGRLFPVGIAYVMELPEKGAQLQFVFVADPWRRQGFGKEIVHAVMQRWPNLMWTSAMGEQGEGLLRSVGLVFDDE